jgi:CheY-like chemotaxis protein
MADRMTLDRPTLELFQRHVRDGLNNLQDPSYLRASPLVAVFKIPLRFDTPSELQRILVEAIQALEPRPDEPPDSRAWRMYESLYYRYVERYDQDAVASQLGMSDRQVRREQKAALEALAYKLWEEYVDPGPAALQTQTSGTLPSSASPRAGASPQAGASLAASAPLAASAITEEVTWLKNEPPEDPADLNLLLPAVVELLRPLAANYGVQIVIDADDAPKVAAVDAIVMKQVLINLLSIAIPRTPRQNPLSLKAAVNAWEIQVTVDLPAPASSAAPLSIDEQSQMEMARYLLQHYGGRLSAVETRAVLRVTLTLPGLEQLPILLVDDNESIHQLFQRYASGTRYHLISAHNPADVLPIIERTAPQVILLDVMMPRIDGWELLGRLRSNPATSSIPVVICTIMAQAEVALSLGAKGFLQKPVNRQAFLTCLDRLMADQKDSTAP